MVSTDHTIKYVCYSKTLNIPNCKAFYKNTMIISEDKQTRFIFKKIKLFWLCYKC